MPFNTAELIRPQIERLLPFVAPILVYPRIQCETSQWITGGSTVFISTPNNRFLITAEHVLREIEQQKKMREVVVLVGGTSTEPIDITDWPILARDDFLDVCTIQVPPEFDSLELNKQFFHISNWPPVEAAIGNEMLIMGYPAAHRVGYDQTINARFLPVCDYVTDVGPRRFTIADENNEREILINPENLEFPNHLGGMSGAPVFKLVNETDPEFLGIFTEGSDGLRGAYFCTHAYFLLSNGKLDAARIPPR